MSQNAASPIGNYRYAAARLACDHAERRLQNALAAFVDSLDERSITSAPRAEALKSRLSRLREESRTPAAARMASAALENALPPVQQAA
jgi:hypothetical protein